MVKFSSQIEDQETMKQNVNGVGGNVHLASHIQQNYL